MSRSKCPKCQVDLRSCVQCVQLRPERQLGSAETIPARISPKDVANECNLFSGRTSWERETTAAVSQNPKEPTGAKKAFDDFLSSTEWLINSWAYSPPKTKLS